MKPTFQPHAIICFLIATFGLLFGQNAFAVATLPFYDGFPASLTPDGGGITNVDVNWTNTTTSAGLANVIVSSTYAQSYPGLKTPDVGSKGAHLWNNGLSTAVGVQIATTGPGSVYASFLMKITTNTSGSRVIFEMNTSTGGAVSSPPFGIALNNDNTLSLFKTALIVTKTPALTVGTTYLVVARYTFNTGSSTDDTLDLWLNPDASTFGPSGIPPTASIASVGSGNTDAASGFRTVDFGLLTSSTGAYDFDEVRAGTTWADVTPIDVAAAAYYRSHQTGNWSDYTTWDRSPDGLVFTAASAGQIPTNTDYVTVSNSLVVTVTSAASAATLTIDGGTLDIASQNPSIGGTVILTNGGSILGASGVLSGSSYTMNSGTASANLGGASATMTVSGPVSLNGTNTYGGSTTVSAGGSLKLGNASALGLTSAGTTVSSTGFLDLNGQTIGVEPLTIAGGGTSLAALTNSSATDASLAGLVTLTGNSYFGGDNNIILSGGVTQSTSTARNLNKIGAGKLTLTGPSTYTGTNYLRAGTLRVGSPSALAGGWIATGFSTSDTTTLELGSAGSYTNSGVLLQGIIYLTAPGGAASLTFTNPSVMAGTGSRVIDAGNNVTLYVEQPFDLFGSTSTINRNLNVQDTGSVVFDASITNTDTSGNYVGGLHLLGPGTLTLNAANAYNGNTTIDGGTLILGAGASILNSTNITVAADATLDVSAAGFTLGANQIFGNNLNNTNSTDAGILKGSLNASLGAMALDYTNGTAALTVTGGTLTLAAGTAFTVIVTNNGAGLGVGSYKLVSKGAGGTVGGIAPTTVSVGGDGVSAGLTDSLSISNGELYLVVAGGSLVQPVIGGISASGGNTVLSFSGTSGQTWNVVTSTNLTSPVSTWVTNAAGTFSGAPVYYTNTIGADAQRFFLIKSP